MFNKFNKYLSMAMFKKEVAQRAARVMGNVIHGPISRKDHELLSHYLRAPRSLTPQVGLSCWVWAMCDLAMYV